MRMSPLLRAGSLAILLPLFACSSPASKTAAPAATTTPPQDETPPAEETPAPTPEPMNPFAAKVDELFSNAAKTSSFSGSVIVVDGGKTVLAKGYGFADREKKIVNAPETIFRVGSISKQFTAAAILSLADEGKLSVTDLVSKHLPEYPKENLAKDGVELTLHHLLSQTSGLPDGLKTKYFKSNVWRQAIDPKLMLAATFAEPLVRKPGTQFEYLNYNYFILGLIVERVSGKTYDAFMRERFFGPLGMKDTGVLPPASLAARIAHGYEAKTGTTTMDDDPTFKDHDLTCAFGAGQVYSTVIDLAKWSQALDDGSALAPKARDLLFTPNLSDYGYGWLIQRKRNIDFQWHNGALSPLGFSSYVLRVPGKQHRFAAYLSNMNIDLIEPFELSVEDVIVR